jgi:RecG-like helicase
MAPTETLAEQHFLTLDEPCRELGVTCALLTGSVKHDRRLRTSSSARTR